jgi:hypothetical protein
MKKYAILGPRLRVFRVIESETEPRNSQRFEEITDEQAQTIADGSGGFFLIDGALTPAQEHLQSQRWNAETESWEGVLLPLWDRVKAITDQLPPTLKVQFPFEKYAYWKEQGDVDACRAIIAGFDTTGYPVEIQQAQEAILAEFDK